MIDLTTPNSTDPTIVIGVDISTLGHIYVSTFAAASSIWPVITMPDVYLGTVASNPNGSYGYRVNAGDWQNDATTRQEAFDMLTEAMGIEGESAARLWKRANEQEVSDPQLSKERQYLVNTELANG